MRLTAARIFAPGGNDPAALLADIDAGRPRWAPEDALLALKGQQVTAARAETPTRPKWMRAGAWRRLSRLSRMVAVTAGGLVEARPELARDTLGLIWGTSLGELEPTGRLLVRLFEEGPAATSPLAFQNSVYNAAVGHLSIALGLRGPTDTVCGLGATGSMVLLRAALMLELGVAPAVLAVAGDALEPLAARGYELSGLLDPPPGEGVAALLLEPGLEGPGVPIAICSGLPEVDAGRVWMRRAALPGDAAELPDCAPWPNLCAPEAALGRLPTLGLLAVAALAASPEGGTLIEHEDGVDWTVRVGERARRSRGT